MAKGDLIKCRDMVAGTSVNRINLPGNVFQVMANGPIWTYDIGAGPVLSAIYMLAFSDGTVQYYDVLKDTIDLLPLIFQEA